jgi:Protein of unknown function (DUF1553)/Protein of unknown function (DUF1549)
MTPLSPHSRQDGLAAAIRCRRGLGAPKWLLTGFLSLTAFAARELPKPADLWSMQPVVQPPIPSGVSGSANPIDAFLAASAQDGGVTLFGAADPLTWLRRVTFDLTGLPPTPEEQEAFLENPSAAGRDRTVERLLASEQHGVHYGRHWLDILRYADLDENMPAAPGIHLWRDWVIASLNRDLPYDDFVRAQICGNRAAKRHTVSPEGHLTDIEARPEDLFALGFLSRGATSRANKDQQLSFAAVETASTAFLGMTVGCARCHDHFFDPIRQSEYYSLKAIFDPMVIRPVELATPAERFARGRAVAEHDARVQVVAEAMRSYIEPYHRRLYEERLSALPAEAQAAIRKPEATRTRAEQKTAEDYHPILRIDPPKIREVMPADQIPRYDAYLKELAALKAPEPLTVFWTVEDDSQRATEKSYVLTTGDPARPKLSQEVTPGFLFASRPPEFRDGRREAFADWLTAPENPLFARVAVNRIWQWHFGTGLHSSSSDFGALGGQPIHPRLLDWLAAEFIAHRYSMKWLHRLIVTSDAYRRASAGTVALDAANRAKDPDNRLLWKFPLNRLEAEPIRDALLQAAGVLDLTVGGKSYEAGATNGTAWRRTAYLRRGYQAFREVMPAYLQTFDAEDGRTVCPRRTQTVTAPQALFLMNNELIETTSIRLGERLREQSQGDLPTLVTLGYQITLGRTPTDAERQQATDLLRSEPQSGKSLAWLLFNLDEFIHVR